jgi:transposase-like protein
MANPIDPTAVNPPAVSIVKSDRTGRARYTRQYKQEVLDAFESSSLSAPAFARHCGIKHPTFAAWIAARKRAARPEALAKPAFLLAEVPGTGQAAGLEVRLPGGAVLRAADSLRIKLLAELLRHLA